MIRWAVAGIGDITTKRVIPAILAQPDSELRGVITRDPAKGEPYGCRVWTDFAEALRDPAVDAVYVATPVALHAPQTIAALRAGKHVLCEKPMAMHWTEACTMQRASEETGRTLGIAYYRRMYPKLRKARDLIREGAIGRPVFAEANCHGWFQDEDGRRPWVLQPEMAGGGPLYDIASHRIDAFNFLFGEPRRVAAQLSNVVHQSRVEDSATLLVEYANGARGVIDVRWHCRVERDDFRVIGTDGELVLSPLTGPDMTAPAGVLHLPRHANLHYPCVENFVDALLGRAELESTGANALWTDWVTDRAMGRAT